MPRFDVTLAGELNLDLILYGLPDELPPERELLAEATARLDSITHSIANRRSFRRLPWVTASNGEPNRSPLRVFTSQITTTLRSVATMSNSPSEHRQFRASTTSP